VNIFAAVDPFLLLHKLWSLSWTDSHSHVHTYSMHRLSSYLSHSVCSGIDICHFAVGWHSKNLNGKKCKTSALVGDDFWIWRQQKNKKNSEMLEPMLHMILKNIFALKFGEKFTFFKLKILLVSVWKWIVTLVFKSHAYVLTTLLKHLCLPANKI
jgi:hypothetical protein